MPLALLALLLLGPDRASAWNSVGHMTTARLAYAELSRRQKDQIAALLRQHPHYEQYLSRNCPEGIAVEEWAFLRASIWPDWIRPLGRSDPRGDAVTGYNRPSDHYINKPFILPGDERLFAGKDLQPGANADNILNALRRRIEEVRSADKPAKDRAVALCWVLHLIGDLHQPLHAVSLYSSLFPDADGDRGGNLFGVKVGGRPTNLHRYWDDLLGEDPNYKEDTAERFAKVARLVQLAVEELHDPRYARDRLPELVEHRTIASWIDESFDLARKVTYREGKLRAVRTHRDGSVPPDAVEAGEEYERAAHEVARRRIALATYRLADQLKECLPDR
jgi:hypothetical protein